jgi:HEAT repeat protein
LRKAATEALGKIGDFAVEPLIAALELDRHDSRIRRAAATALGSTGDARAMEPLVASLCDCDRYLRKAATDALTKLADARALESLVGVLDDEDDNVRWAAAEALRRIGMPTASKPSVDDGNKEKLLHSQVLGRTVDS